MRRSITETIERLKKSSTGPADMGHRYSRLLQLLWRKAPQQGSNDQQEQGVSNGTQRPTNKEATGPLEENEVQQTINPLGAFSWRDLDSVGQFVINDDVLAANTVDFYDENMTQFSAFDVFTADPYNTHDLAARDFTF